MKNRNIHSFRILSSLALILLTSGCYTILNHPRVESEPSKSDEYYSCSDCHDHHTYTGYYTPVAYPGMWNNYYIEPWWYNELSEQGEQNIPTRSIIGDRDVIIRNDRLNSNTINIDFGPSIIRENTESKTIEKEKKSTVIEKIKENKKTRLMKKSRDSDQKGSRRTNERESEEKNRRDNNANKDKSDHKKRPSRRIQGQQGFLRSEVIN